MSLFPPCDALKSHVAHFTESMTLVGLLCLNYEQAFFRLVRIDSNKLAGTFRLLAGTLSSACYIGGAALLEEIVAKTTNRGFCGWN